MDAKYHFPFTEKSWLELIQVWPAQEGAEGTVQFYLSARAGSLITIYLTIGTMSYGRGEDAEGIRRQGNLGILLLLALGCLLHMSQAGLKAWGGADYVRDSWQVEGMPAWWFLWAAKEAESRQEPVVQSVAGDLGWLHSWPAEREGNFSDGICIHLSPPPSLMGAVILCHMQLPGGNVF